MESINIFKRQELKFILTDEQVAAMNTLFNNHLQPDTYSDYLVQSIYFDTENWDIIRASIEKPIYKEKMRLRCYGIPGQNSTMFLELKKKYRGVVHKRRISFPVEELSRRTAREIAATSTSITGRELNKHFETYPVSEKVHISYRRKAYSDGNDLRITCDTDLKFRTNELDYQNPNDGLDIISKTLTIMEIKTLGGMPMWLAQALSKLRIFPTSFSKYGVGYKKHILQLEDGGIGSWIILPRAL